MDGFTKQTGEIFPIQVDFNDVLDDGETLVSAGSTVTAYQGTEDVSDEVLDANSKTVGSGVVSIKVQAGTDQTRYKLTFSATTSAGNVYEKDVYMMVRDI